MPKIELTLKQGDRTLGSYHLLQPGEYSLGRDSSCSVPVDDSELSRQHACLRVGESELVLEDLGSATGTFVDGVKIAGPVPLQGRETIRLGSTILRLRALEENPPDVTAVPSRSATPRDADQTVVSPRQTPSEPEQKVRATIEFNVGQEVAHGGMGAILTAKDSNIRRTVAMKVMRSGREVTDDLKQRFVQEAQLTGQLEHPNIVPVHELGVDQNGKLFYTMKFVKGITLHAVLSNIRHGEPEAITRFPLGQLLTIFQKACDAVAFAHSKGVIHRDLKPENIMIGEYGEVLVMDWGLAKLIEDRGSKIEDSERQSSILHSPSSGLTMDGQIMGTPQFMAPEQAEGKVDEIDARADIFSLGAILYNILTLRPPVSGGSVQEVLQKIRTGEIVPPTSYNLKEAKAKRRAEGQPKKPIAVLALRHCPDSKIPESLSAVTMKALALRREDRYQSVQEFQKDIEAYQGGFATTAEHAGTLKLLWLLIKRRRIEAAALGVILALLMGFGTNAIVTGRRAKATLAELRGTAPTFYAQSQALIKEHQFDEALQKISYALVLAPADARYHAMKGNILQSLLRFSEAEQAYAEAMRWDKNAPLAQENLKLCHKLRQQNEGRAELLPSSLSELQAAMRQQQRLDEAVALALRTRKDNAQAYETWKAVLLKTGLVPPEEIRSRYSMDGTGLIELNLVGINPPSIAPLKGMPLKRLNLAADPERESLTDLSPLKGMPLEWLTLAANKHITDLSPLKGMPLKLLELNSCGSLVDLAPLKGMPLEKLNLASTQVNSLSPLRSMPLRSLLLQGSRVTDLSPLQGMALKYLSLGNTRISDLSPLHGMPLETLDLKNLLITDLRVLQGMPLKELGLFGCKKLQDLTPLADCPTLERLRLPAQCKDIEFLRKLPKLQRLSYDDSPWEKAQTAAEFWKEWDANKQKEGGR